MERCRKGHKNVLGVAIGTGIGGGIICRGGKLISGKMVSVLEKPLGHIKVEKDGKLCGCGQKDVGKLYPNSYKRS